MLIYFYPSTYSGEMTPSSFLKNKLFARAPSVKNWEKLKKVPVSTLKYQGFGTVFA